MKVYLGSSKKFLEEVKDRMLESLSRADQVKYLLEQDKQNEVLKKVSEFVKSEGFELKGRKFYDINYFKKIGMIWAKYDLIFWKEKGKPLLRLDGASVIETKELNTVREVMEKNGYIVKRFNEKEEIWVREIRW